MLATINKSKVLLTRPRFYHVFNNTDILLPLFDTILQNLKHCSKEFKETENIIFLFPISSLSKL